MTQLASFLTTLQHGQELSLETQWGVTLIFEDQGNPGGYGASAGNAAQEMTLESAGVIMETRTKAFRILRSIVTADGIEIVARKTVVVCDGKRYLVDQIGEPPGDPCLHLVCKES